MVAYSKSDYYWWLDQAVKSGMSWRTNKHKLMMSKFTLEHRPGMPGLDAC